MYRHAPLIAILVGLLGLAWAYSWPTTVEECVLDQLPNGAGDFATQTAYAACLPRYPRANANCLSPEEQIERDRKIRNAEQVLIIELVCADRPIYGHDRPGMVERRVAMGGFGVLAALGALGLLLAPRLRTFRAESETSTNRETLEPAPAAGLPGSPSAPPGDRRAPSAPTGTSTDPQATVAPAADVPALEAAGDPPAPVADEATPRADVWTTHPPRPWLRFFARTLDIFIVGTLAVVLIGPERVAQFVFPIVESGFMRQAIVSVAAVLLAALTSTVFLMLFGTTPGKLLFGIRVVPTGDGVALLNPGEALRRELHAMAQGLAFGIPYAWAIAAVIESNAVREEGETAWDKHLGIQVRYAPDGEEWTTLGRLVGFILWLGGAAAFISAMVALGMPVGRA